jgi:hypothetical protein
MAQEPAQSSESQPQPTPTDNVVQLRPIDDPHQCYLDCVDAGGTRSKCFAFCYGLGPGRPNLQEAAASVFPT